jgi:hypothetical protein
MKTNKFIVAIFLFIFFLLGCSSRPSEEAAKKYLLSLPESCKDCIKIVSFKKTNGIKDGIRYQFFFDAEIIFLKDAQSMGLAEKRFENLTPSDKNFVNFLMTSYKKGEHYRLDGIIHFIESEKGWLPSQRGFELDHFEKIGG